MWLVLITDEKEKETPMSSLNEEVFGFSFRKHTMKSIVMQKWLRKFINYLPHF